jgi:hypothetical protein
MRTKHEVHSVKYGGTHSNRKGFQSSFCRGQWRRCVHRLPEFLAKIYRQKLHDLNLQENEFLLFYNPYLRYITVLITNKDDRVNNCREHIHSLRSMLLLNQEIYLPSQKMEYSSPHVKKPINGPDLASLESSPRCCLLLRLRCILYYLTRVGFQTVFRGPLLRAR